MPIGPEVAAAALALAAAAAWGAGDFGGGLLARRTDVLGVVLVSQVAGLVIAAAIAVGRGEPVPGPGDAAWAGAAGLFGGMGIAALYRGLAAGRMGIIAPVTGVIAPAIPVAIGIALAGPPGPVRALGLGLGMAAVVLVSRSSEAGPARAGLGLAVGAGISFGLFFSAISMVGPGLLFGPLVIARAAAIAFVGAAIVVARRPWRPPARLAVAILGVAALDIAGNAFFLAATQAGRLDVAAVLSSLYPVTTVLLAVVVLRERVTGTHALGIVAAGAAIACISLG